MSQEQGNEPDYDEIESRRVCVHCVKEPYLIGEIIRTGTDGTCYYCAQEHKTWPVAELADRVEKAFAQHFQRTSENPDAFESALQNDADSTYTWHRHGTETAYAIADAAQIEEGLAEDVRGILAERNFDFDDAKMGLESEFAKDAHYEEKATDDSELQTEWHHFEQEVRNEARFFSVAAQGILGRVFAQVHGHRTRKRQSVIVRAGPSKKLKSFFRARVFQSSKKLEEALLRPDLEIGPPPDGQARPGRMNATGISVFYGARTRATALSEVRPPVGSDVMTAQFDLVKEVRLLDVEALADVLVEGSIFDPGYLQRLEHAKFLGALSRRIARVVMPDEEASGYLVTQVIADYLANIVKLDGLLYRSVQQGSATGNVVLFRHASRVDRLDLPKGTKIRAYYSDGTEDGGRDLTVYEEIPDPPAVEPIVDPWTPLDLSTDARAIVLKLQPASVEVHTIKAASYKAEVHSVRRHRIKQDKGPQPF